MFLSKIAACAFVGAAAFTIGLSLPMREPAARYDLVRYVGEESDIIDHGMTLDDCAYVVPRMRAMGFKVACEMPLSNSTKY